MAIDSTELTFVRCPSCRSLVPTVNPRCKMCGAKLDSQDAASEVEDTPPSPEGRIRQRTISGGSQQNIPGESPFQEPTPAQTPEETLSPWQAAESAPYDSEPVPPAPEPVQQSAVSQEDPEIDPLSDDPLAAFMEGGDDDFTSDWEPEIPSQVIKPQESGTHFESSPPAEQVLPEEEEFVPDAPTPEPEPVSDELNGTAEQSYSRVSIETGHSGKRGGLSFSRKEVPDTEEHAEEAPPRKKTARLDQEEAEDSPVKTRKKRRRRRRRSRKSKEVQLEAENSEQPEAIQPPAPEPEQAPVEEHSAYEAEEPVEEEPSSPPPRAQATQKKSIKPSPATNGRLFGWFVSYLDADGSAIDLREGKFFISSQGLKENDLVIEDESVSVPHAMITISPELGIEVRDLMSDRGIFVRPNGRDSYQRIDEVAMLEHGDWVRFGDVEFLVSRVAHVGEV